MYESLVGPRWVISASSAHSFTTDTLQKLLQLLSLLAGLLVHLIVCMSTLSQRLYDSERKLPHTASVLTIHNALSEKKVHWGLCKPVTGAVPFQKGTLLYLKGAYGYHNCSNMYHEGTNMHPLATKVYHEGTNMHPKVYLLKRYRPSDSFRTFFF